MPDFWSRLKSITRKSQQVNIVESNNDNDYEINKVGSIEIPDKLTEGNAFTLANTVAEIYFPIDFCADRISKLRFYLADKSGNEILNSELNRFITNINPLYSFSDLVYQYLFSYLSDGNAISYIGIPGVYKKPSVGSISRIDILEPNLLDIREYYNLSILDAGSLNSFISFARYFDSVATGKILDPTLLRINKIDATRKETSNIFSKSPLFKSYRNINNLLAVYSARYNVYVNNGAAGYLAKKTSGKSGDMDTVVDPITRDAILSDINNRNGLTGRRNLWGISSVPLEFVSTMADIQALMPLDETLENSIKIAGNFGIKAGLVPRKDQSTFSNQKSDEQAVWENALMSLTDLFCANWTSICTLDKVGVKVMADYSTVGALQSNESDIEDTNAKKLNNLKLIKELNPGANVSTQTQLILDSYGK